MKTQDIDLSSFERNSGFYSDIKLVLTIKSFDLQAIRQRYLKSRKNVSGKAGSVERRAVSKGGLVKLNLSQGELKELDLVGDLFEPRGIDYKEGRLAVSLENEVHVFKDEETYTLKNPWFSYIHTVDFNKKDHNRILITSSGYECLHEYDFVKNELVWDWFAWDHGLNEANNPEDNSSILLTRDKDLSKSYEEKGIAHILIDDPKGQSLPTAKRAAFINTARYDHQNADSIFLTLFHEGSVRVLEKSTGNSRIILDGMKSPHGGQRFDSETVISTNTAGGSVELLKDEERTSLKFHSLPSKPEELGRAEWLQNSIRYNSLIVTIDSNRNALVVIDPESRKYDLLPYNNNWALQDLMVYNNENEEIIDRALDYFKSIK